MTQNTSVHPRIVVSGLWITMMFIFAYVDLFGLMRAFEIEEILAGRVGPFAASQMFFVLTTIYVMIPALMIALTLTLPRGINRWANIVLAVLYAITVIGGCIGETWLFYLLGSAVEVVLLGFIGWIAWTAL